MARKDRLISADVFFDELVELQHSEQSMGIMHSWYPHMRGIVCRQPTVDVAPVVHGRWKYVAETKDAKSGYACSECFGPVWHAPDVPSAFLYCPNCGAKMDGGKANEM